MEAPDSGKIMNVAMLLGLLVVLFIVYKLMAAVGIIKTGASKRADKEKEGAVNMLRTDEYWQPTYYKGKTYKSIGSNAANLYAQNIRKSLRGIGTDEELIYSTMGKLFNKINISEIAASYFLQYNKDLQTDLLNDLSAKEVVNLMNIVNALPNK
jgi:hypothetical protein